MKLQRFKAAFQPDPISLEPFQVIIGRNGSGKSTLLEALQWLDRTLRQDARAACDRYFGIHDLINVRSRADVPYFEIRLDWEDLTATGPRTLTYVVRVEQGSDSSTPLIAEESLYTTTKGTKGKRFLIKTEGSRRPGHEPGVRVIYPEQPALRSHFDEPDRLALGRGGMRARAQGHHSGPFELLQDFWERAVFLRLSPNRLVAGSAAKRRSFEPLLDEEGQNLPALLVELNKGQLEALTSDVGNAIQGIEGVILRKGKSADQQINYALKERMPYVGRAGTSAFTLPSWMLSEGTRRITAIYALLARRPPASLLCIEEVENGLDFETVLKVMSKLKAGADRGTQVLLTTHSPWLLDHVEMSSICQVIRVDGDTRYEPFADRDAIKAFAANIPPGTRYVHESK